MKIKYIVPMLLIAVGLTARSQEFDITITGTDSGTKTYTARNSITIGPDYSYTPSGGTLTVEITNPVVTDDISYNYTIVDPETRSLNTAYLVGTTNGSFNVNALGGATYTIPIDVPPGIGGLQPGLTLSYNSLGGPGVAGYGWNISGISAITRSPQNFYNDGAATGIDLSITDRFSLDGQRLICTSGTYGGNGSQYRTENDIFTRVTCYSDSNGPSQFFAETKSGLDCQYGYDSDADQTIDGYSNVVNWYMNKMTDVYGNEVNYQYIKDNGSVYLAEITYGQNTVTFYYQQRSDKTSAYLKGSKIEQNLILERIEAKYNGTLVKKYEFKYNYPSSNYTRYSVLNEVVEYGIGGSRLNSTAFSYQSPDAVAFAQTIYNNTDSYITYKSKLYFGDFNGDGKEDVFCLPDADKGATWTGWRMYLGDGNDNFQFACSGSVPTDNNAIVYDVSTADINADNLEDVFFHSVYSSGGYTIKQIHVMTSNGSSFSSPVLSYGGLTSMVLDPKSKSGDITGDGIVDFLLQINSTNWAILSRGNSSGELTGTLSAYTANTIASFGNFSYLSDFDGDGKIDLWIFDSSGTKIYSFNGSTFTQVYNSSIPTSNHHFRLGDFNADGKTDMFIYGYTTYDWSDWQMHLSTGTGFETNYIPRKKSNLKNDIVRTGDFNGDGATDLMVMAVNDAWSGHYYYISKNQGTDLYSHFYSGAQSSTHSYFIADYNGDGRDDYLCTDGLSPWWNGYMIYKTGTKNRIMLEKTANGSNQYTKINYTNLSQASSSVYTKGTGASFPVFDYQGVLPVVSSVLTDNGRGSQNTVNYAYQGAKIHRQGKGFLCYSKQTVTDVASNLITESNYEYHTSYYFPKLTLTENKYSTSTTLSSTNNIWLYISTAGSAIMPYIYSSTQTNNLTGHSVTQTASYDTYGNPTAIVKSFNNGVTETTSFNSYDDNTTNWWLGRLSSKSVSYEKSGETTITRNTTYSYYSDGILKPDWVNYLSGTSVNYSQNNDYDSNGNLIQIWEYNPDGGARQTNYTYETNGIRVKTITDPLRHITTKNYDSYGRLSSEVDYLSNTSSFTYDNMGRMATHTQPDGFVTTNSYIWGLSGGPTYACYYIQQTGNEGFESKTWYDELGREIRSDVKGFNGSYIYTVTDYNNLGQVSQVSEPSTSSSPLQWNSNTYDSYGRITDITRPTGRNTHFDYESNGSRVTETTAGKTSYKETDSQGLVTLAHDNGGDITYTYYPDGKTKTITAPGSVGTSMQYDIAGNQTQLVDPSAGTINYTWNGFGQLKTQTNARSQTTTYTYLSDGRLNTKATVEGTDTYSYNTNKQLTGISNSTTNVSRSFGYDSKGRVNNISETIPGSTALSTSFTYDTYGRLSTRTHPSGIVETNNYNSYGYLSSVSAGGTTRWTVTSMNARQQITAATYGSSLSASYGYDSYGYPSSTTTGSIQDYRYSFTASTGNLYSRQNYLRSLSESFTYDNLDRLTGVSGLQNLTMAYNANGNINTKDDVSDVPFGYNNTSKPYALTDIEATDSLISDSLQTITYTSFEQPTSITENPYQATFIYNSDDQRAKMLVTDQGSTILTRWYAGSRYMKETAGSTTKEYTWIGGNAYSAPVVAVKEGSTTNYFYLLRDYLGNITHQVNTSNTVVAEYSYDAWSRRRDKDDWSYTLSGEPDLLAGRSFTSHEYLPWFKLVNMNGRLYDPIVARFLSPDENVQMSDFTQNFNRYSYALNNPLRYTDPDGEFIFTLLAALIPGAQPLLPFAIAADVGWMTDYGMQVAMNHMNGFKGSDAWFKKIDWFDVGVSAVVSGVTGGYGAEFKAGKELGKLGAWVVKNRKLITLGEMALTSAVDITGEGWQEVEMDDFIDRFTINLATFGVTEIVSDYTKNLVKKPGVGNNFEDYLNSGTEIDRNGLTKSGRALQKHGSRTGSVFPQVSGKELNLKGQSVLSEILNSPTKKIVPNRFGGYDIFDLLSNRGARFGSNKNFIGFLEP